MSVYFSIDQHFCKKPLFVFLPVLILCRFLRAKALLKRKHICTHFCEHLAIRCRTFNTSGTNPFWKLFIFVLATIVKCAKARAPVNVPTAHTCTLLWILSVVLSWGSRPLQSPQSIALTRGGRAYLGPRPFPRPYALAAGVGRQMPFRPPCVPCFCGQSIQSITCKGHTFEPDSQSWLCSCLEMCMPVQATQQTEVKYFIMNNSHCPTETWSAYLVLTYTQVHTHSYGNWK